MSKYHAKKIVVGGEVFDSQKEYRRFRELSLLQRAGEIEDLKRQVEYELIPAQREPDTVGARGGIKKGRLIEQKCSYIADYVYTDDKGNIHVEDVKGYKDGGAYRVFVIKRKLMLYIHGIIVEEV